MRGDVSDEERYERKVELSVSAGYIIKDFLEPVVS